jgi:hypothetical protein
MEGSLIIISSLPSNEATFYGHGAGSAGLPFLYKVVEKGVMGLSGRLVFYEYCPCYG